MKPFVLIFFVCLVGLPSKVIANAGLPVEGPITSGVGWRIDPFGSGGYHFHRGVDVAVAEGTPVHATVAGTVVVAGKHGGHGNTVVIAHADGTRTLYGHNRSLSVHKGQYVEAGDVVALSGNSGRSTGPHVHYEVLSQESSDMALTMMPGNAPVDAGLRERLQLDGQLDAIMGSFVNNVRSSLLAVDRQNGG